MSERANKLNFMPILRTYSQVDMAMIKSLLEGNVEYYFKDENFMSIRPMLEPTELMVREDFVDEVKELLHDFELNYMAVSLKDDETDEDADYNEDYDYDEDDDFDESDDFDEDDEYIL